MKIFDWAKEISIPVTICDKNGLIIYMNDASIKQFHNDGGKDLIGKSLLDCHPEPAKTKLLELLNTQKENSYITEKNGITKLIHQFPFYEDGNFAGLVEITLVMKENIINQLKNS